MRRLTSFLSLCTLMPALMLSAPGTAVASHDGTRNGGDVASLVAAVAEANQRMADIGGDIQVKQEGVNGALVEIAAARDTLAQARRDVAASEQALTDSQHAIDAAQQRFEALGLPAAALTDYDAILELLDLDEVRARVLREWRES